MSLLRRLEANKFVKQLAPTHFNAGSKQLKCLSRVDERRITEEISVSEWLILMKKDDFNCHFVQISVKAAQFK